MPTIRYVQRPSAAASSAQLRPEHVSSGGATGTSAIALAGAGPDNNKFAGPTAPAAAPPADDSSSNNNGIENAHASTHARGESEGAGRLVSAPPPPPPPPGVGLHAGQVSQAQAQLQQKAVVTPDKPTAVSRFDTPDDDVDQFADAAEDDDGEDDERDAGMPLQ